MSSPSVNSFKIAVMGDAGVGKTTWLQRIVGTNTPTFPDKIRVSHTIVAAANGDPVVLNFHEFAKEDWTEFYVAETRRTNPLAAAILVFDTTSMASYNSLPEMYERVKTAFPEAPIIVIGTKYDCFAEREVKHSTIQFPAEHGLRYIAVSVNADFNVVRPINYLVDRLIAASKEDHRTAELTAEIVERLRQELRTAHDDFRMMRKRNKVLKEANERLNEEGKELYHRLRAAREDNETLEMMLAEREKEIVALRESYQRNTEGLYKLIDNLERENKREAARADAAEEKLWKGRF